MFFSVSARVGATRILSFETHRASPARIGDWGSYRLDVELRPGERIVKRPGETRIDKSDLDPKRDFLLSGGA